MMDSKDSALTPSIVISPAEGCLKDDLNNQLYTSLAISIKHTTTSSPGHETYEYEKTEVRHYSTSSEPSSSPEKTVESQTSSPTETTLVAEDVVSAGSDPGTMRAPSSPPEAIPSSTATPPKAPVLARSEISSRDERRAEESEGARVPSGTIPFEIDWNDHENRAAPPPPLENGEPRSSTGWGLQALSSSPPNNAPSNSSRSSVHVGLVNQAMTCYLNSLIQALFMTPEFRNALYKWEFTGSSDEEQHSIPYHLQKLFLNLQTSQRNAVETTKLTRSFGWDSSEAWHQHDIQELCRVMFEALERKFSNTDQADFIQRLYEGKMLDYVNCLECRKEKSRTDTFMDIPLPVKPYGNTVAYQTIEEALDGFVQAETLEGNNQYFCETCNKKCNAQKGLKFSHFPYILTLHLKRFDFDHNTLHRIKLNDKVSFPEVLNLNDYIVADGDGPNSSDTSAMPDLNSTCSTNGDMCSCSDADEGIDETTKSDCKKCLVRKKESPGPYEYELFSIMIHSGSASGGHYFAYIKDFDTNEWFCFNDDVVSPFSHEDIVENFCSNSKNRYSGGFSSTPYMLMYRQIDKEKNASFMKANEFPDHVKKLVEVVQKEDEEEQNKKLPRSRRTRDVYNDSEEAGPTSTVDRSERLQEDDNIKIKVHFEQAGTKKTNRWLVYTADDKLGGFINVAAQVFGVSYVSPQKLRLSIYTPGGIPIVEEIKGDSEQFVASLFPKNPEASLLLSVVEDAPESDSTCFEKQRLHPLHRMYSTGSVIIIDPVIRDIWFFEICVAVLVRAVSLDSLELFGLTMKVEYTTGMTIGQLKKKIATDIGVTPVKGMFIITDRPCRKAFSDDETVQQAKTQCSKFLAAFSQTRDMDITEVYSCVTDILDRNVKVKCKFVGISRDLLTRFGTNAMEIAKADWRKATAFSNCRNDKRFSEDSSLTDSQKTFEDRDSASTNVDLKSTARSAVQAENLATNGSLLPNGTEDDGAKVNPADYIFTVQDIDDNSPELSLSVSSKMTVAAFKATLAQFVGLPESYIKLSKHPKDKKDIGLSTFPMGDLAKDTLESLCVKIFKPVNQFTVNWQIHKLDPKPWEAVYLFDCGLEKSMTVVEAKKVILGEMKDRGFEVMPLERCRLRRVLGGRPKNVLLDELTVRELLTASSCHDILVQEREGPEQVENSSQSVVNVRNFDCNEEDAGRELVLKTSFDSTNPEITDFYEKLSLDTGIPVDSLDVRILYLSSGSFRKWLRQDFKDVAIKLIDNGHVFYYRDMRVPIEDEGTKDAWDEYLSVKDYLEGKTKIEGMTENQSENCESGNFRSKFTKREPMRRSRLHSCRPNFRMPDEPSITYDERLNHANNGETPAPSVTDGSNHNHVESSSEPERETLVKSYRSKERGLKIYVEPTTPRRSTPEPTS